jgi:hypothetical protein
MTSEEALAIVDSILAPKRLSSIQELVICSCWEQMTYQEIAQNSDYDANYIRLVGSRLWQELTIILGEKITKSNIHAVLRQYSENGLKANVFSPALEKVDRADVSQFLLPEFPGGTRPLNCPFYVDFFSIAEECYKEILKPGALIRIKSPEKRGKSSLMVRILAHAELHGYRTASLNLYQAEEEILYNLDRFLRWFCANLSQQLELEPKLDDYWDIDLGSKVSCTSYLQGYILAQIDSPLAMALDEVHRLFEFPVAQDFLSLLRLWHEEAKNLDAWTKLRPIVVYSTEVYNSLDLNQSPFNVGLPILLPKFNLDQAQDLALRYGLAIADDILELQKLKSFHAMVDGHPFLLNLAFYHLSHSATSMMEILTNAPTQTSIYGEHLRIYLLMLQNNPTLSKAYCEVVMSDAPVDLDAIVAYQLESMGLITLYEDKATPSCDLYRLYFRDRLT